MAKDIGHVLGMILMPPAAGNPFASLFNQAVIHDKKEDIPGRDTHGLKELIQGGLRNFLHSPNIVSQESSEAGERSAQKRTGKGLHHRGRVGLFPQLDKADNKGRENFKRRS